MTDWTINDAEELYGIPCWSDGYFGVGDDGKLLAVPDVAGGQQPIALIDVVNELRADGVQLPVVLRFHDVLKHRVRQLNDTFVTAIANNDYDAPYRGVYPIKVNQMREVVDEVVAAGRPYNYGLEAGSKPELMAVLTYDLPEDALIICNGYKDADYMRLALLGRKIGRKVIVVIEEFGEIETLLRLADEMNIEPLIGLRIKMRTKAEGRWSHSSGERAKFGLPISGMLNAIDLINARGYGESIQLLHFHIGSQLSDIRFVKEAVQEAARIYARLFKRGVPLNYLDIGGGLAVDYEGSRSNNHSSMNYSMADYADGVVFDIKQICDLEDVPHPTLVSESGRAVSAHHSCVVMEVIGEISNNANPVAMGPVEGEHILVSNLRDLLSGLHDEQNYQDSYHHASVLLSDVYHAFKLGILKLEELARAETLYWRVVSSIASMLDTMDHVPEELAEMQVAIKSQYLCNFSLFQSAADVWAIDQVLPVVPLSRLDEPPTKKGTLADITCDSDGRIVQFIGPQSTTPTLPLHEVGENEPYYLGLFLTGAYQDVMGDTHNLFGRLNEAHVFVDADDPSGFYIEEFVPGSSAAQVLQVMQYNPAAMASKVKEMLDRKVAEGTLRSRDGVKLVDFYEASLSGYTYLHNAEG